MNSFNQCGITSYEVNDFHRQLRHCVINNELIDDVEPGDDLGDEENFGFNQNMDDNDVIESDSEIMSDEDDD